MAHNKKNNDISAMSMEIKYLKKINRQFENDKTIWLKDKEKLEEHMEFY